MFQMKTKLLILIIVTAALLAAPFFLGDYYKGLLTEAVLFGLYCLGFDIIFGFTGLLNFGIAVFFGLGGYLMLWSIVHLQTGIWGGMFLMILGSAVFSFIYGMGISRFKSHYFVAFTIVISMIFFYIAMALRPITGGDEGLTFEVPPLNLGLASLEYTDLVRYYFPLFIAGVTLALVWLFFRTPYGKAIVAVRENEDRANMIGYDTTKLKIVAFTLSGTICSLGGALYALHMGFTSAHAFFWIWTARAVWWTIIGGVGTLFGAFVGPGVLVFFEDLLSSWNSDLYLIVMGVIMILAIIFAPQGIVRVVQTALIRKGK
jgi:branched-chain amino acid transport system permease protein